MVKGEAYKYLGFLQLRGIRHIPIKKELQDKFLHRVNCVLRSFLSAGYKAKAMHHIESLLTHSFGVVKWTKTDLEALERAVRVAFIKHRLCHPKSAIERVTTLRAVGGRDVTDIQVSGIAQIQRLRAYFVESRTVW